VGDSPDRPLHAGLGAWLLIPAFHFFDDFFFIVISFADLLQKSTVYSIGIAAPFSCSLF
jgi:hypothetical protein